MKPEHTGIQAFIELTGLDYKQSSHILFRKMGDKRVRQDKMTLYPTDELYALADYYVAGMQPRQAHELSRKDIMQQYRLSNNEMLELIAHEDFPPPSRTYVDMIDNKGTKYPLWDSGDLADIDVYDLLDKDEPDDASKPPFVYQGEQAEWIHVCLGDYSNKLTLGGKK